MFILIIELYKLDLDSIVIILLYIRTLFIYNMSFDPY